MAQLTCQKLCVGYDGKPVLQDLDFEVFAGDYLCIVGENGSGKSTLMKTILGLQMPISGRILTGDGLRNNEIGYLPQQTKVQKDFPASVREIVLSGCQGRCGSRPFYNKEEKKLAADAMGKMQITPLAKRCYRTLSGGQQQRVGIARAFAANPPIVLMDEPFSALDPMTRAELQNEIHDLQTKAQKTVVFVTHDMDEAIKLADRICIIQDGKVAQCDTPENILKHPANQYVTEFIGANRLWANPEYIRAADIMRRRPFTISKGRTVIQALQIMRHNSVDSLLVLDKGQTLLGVVWLEELIGKREADPIEYYISDDYIAVEGETSLKEIIATIDYDVSGIIPVIQHDRKLLGYLTKSIILATMSKQFVPEHTAGERSGVICPATL